MKNIIKNAWGKFKKFYLTKLKFWQAILFLVVMSLALTLFLFLMQPLPFSVVFECIKKTWGLNLLLNWLPLFLLMLLLYFAGTGAASASTIVGAVTLAMGFANRTKILLRNDPFVPWDFMLGGEVFGIIKSFGIRNILITIGLCVLYILLAIIAAFLVRSERLKLHFHAMGIFVCLIFMVFINKPLYKSTSITNLLHIEGNIYNQVNQFNSRGFVYSFIHTYNTNRISKPDGYDRAAVLEKISKFENTPPGDVPRPHIIMIMSEAFSEISMNPHFNFAGFTNPLENWQRIKNDGISGEILVSVLGGGTAQTEFDVLTGMNSRQFSGAPFAFRMISSELESMASVLNSLGYRSEFMHPGHDWFYNRQNVYRYLGFERLMFLDEFNDVPTKGMYVNEHDTINRMLEMFSEHRENHPSTPYFNFTVTIQNHGPYPDKYLLDGPVTGANFSTGLDFTENDINAISNYFHGLADSDRELGRLVNALNALDEPVVLVYFGDHLPAFNARIYDLLMQDNDKPDPLYRVPFLIWQNEAAQINFEPYDENLFFNAPFLGAYVMEILGFTGISPFWDYNMELRRAFPLTDETRSFAMQMLYRDWSYYRLFDER